MWELSGICTIIVSYNLIIVVQQHICFYRTTASVHPNSHKRTHAHARARARTHTHTHTHTSKCSSALYRLFLSPPADDTHATCFTCPSAPYSRILNIFIHIYPLFWCRSLYVYLPVSMISIQPLWNFHAIFNTNLNPTPRLVNFVPVLFVMNYKLTRNAVYLSSVNEKEDSKWRCPNASARISNLISGKFKFRISALKS